MRDVTKTRLVACVKEIGRIIVWTYFALYLRSMGFTAIDIGLAFSLGWVGYLSGLLIGGVLADKLGGWMTTRIVLLLLAISMPGMLVTSRLVLLTAYVLFELAHGVGDVSLSVLLEETREGGRAEEFSLFAGALSLVCGAALIVAVVCLTKMELAEFLSICFAACAVSYIILTPMRVRRRRAPSLEIPETKLTRAKTFYVAIYSMQGVAVMLYWTLMPVFASEVVGMSNVEWSLSIVLWFAVNGVAYLALARRSIVRYFWMYPVLTTLLCYLTLTRSKTLLYVAFALDALATVLYWPVHFSLAMKFGGRSKGRYVGMLNAVRSVALAGASYVAGVLYSLDPGEPIVASAVVYVITSVLLLAMLRQLELARPRLLSEL